MTAPAEADLAVGMECYATRGQPCRAMAKTTPDDFYVEERVVQGELVPVRLPGYLPLYRVEKRLVDTMHMAEQLSAALGSRVSYAGMKDKRGVAVQYVTPTSARADSPPKVAGAGFAATLVGYVPRPLSRGSLTGNGFVVVLRGCCPEVGARTDEAFDLARGGGLPNFYGLQRFGTSGSGTHLIGRELVKGRFEEAVNLMLRTRVGDEENRRRIEEAVSSERYGEVASLLPPGKDVEARVARELGRRPGEWVRALRRIPVGLRRLYVQAYQSLLFNRTLSRAMMRGEDISRCRRGDNWAGVSEDRMATSAVRGVNDPPSGEVVPMVQLAGYAYRDFGSRFDSIASEVLEEEGVTAGEFYLKGMQEASAEGGFRRPHLAVSGASMEVEGGTATLRFALGKGQYATVLLREVLKPSDPGAAGLA